ncbi:MAG: hypothetical protein KBS54_06985 [Synergistaceae bacterium]|nr:hypothetical protein [Candidatus Equadaptatus faecalis]
MQSVNGNTTRKIAFITITVTLAVMVLCYISRADFDTCSAAFLVLSEIIFFKILNECMSADSKMINKIVFTSGSIVTTVLYFVFTLLMTIVSSISQISLNVNLAIQAVALGITLVLLLIFKTFASYIANQDAFVLEKMRLNNSLEQKAEKIAISIKDEKCKKEMQKLCEMLRYANKTVADDNSKEIADALGGIEKLISASADMTEILSAVEKAVLLCETCKVSCTSVKRSSL